MKSDYSNNISPGLIEKIASRISVAVQSDEENLNSTSELDSHADSVVVGRMARILERTGKMVSVSGFTDKLGKPLIVYQTQQG